MTSATVRIVGWNCNQGLARKAAPVLELDPDIVVICEAGRETELGEGRLRRVGWAGRNPTKGLAVFVRDGLGADVHSSWDRSREWFLPVHLDVSGGIDLLAVWAMNHRGQEPRPRQGRSIAAVQHYRDYLAGGRAVVIGDFNNNVRFEKPRYRGFTLLAEEFRSQGYVNLYYERSGEPPGRESVASLYMRYDLTRPYLVDHAYIPKGWLSKVERYVIGQAGDWLQHSDHMPLILDLAI